MDYINELHKLCETISNEIAESNEKIRAAGGKLSAGDVDYIDKLTHAMKSIKSTIAMMEEEDGYSNRGGSYRSYSRDNGGYPRDGGSYRGGSYARGGRGSYARRGGMSRYSGNGGYSGDDDMVEELHELMQDAPNEAVKREIQKLIEKMEQM